jgi:hypothetical protein
MHFFSTDDKIQKCTTVLYTYTLQYEGSLGVTQCIL